MTASEKVRRHTVTNGEVSLAVFEQGNPEGLPLILVHGWPDTHELWSHVIPHLTERFRIISYDTRGAGASTVPEEVAAYRLEELAADFHAVVDAVAPDEKVHVLAHDWGSVEVWEAVTESWATGRIASFTSVSGPSLDHLARWSRERLSRPTPRNVAQPLAQAAASYYTMLFQVPKLPNPVLRHWMSRHWPAFLKFFDGLDPALVRPAPTIESDMVNGVKRYRANLPRRFAAPRERFTSVPVQLVINRRDKAVRPFGYDDERRWVPRLWRREIPSAGHWSPISHARTVAALTAEFIEMIEGAAPSRSLRRSALVHPHPEFAEQLVVVTGAGSGIGRETALAFARGGAELVVADRDLASAQETVRLVEGLGGDAHAYLVDVADEAAVGTFADSVARDHGVPDVVVNNAGIGHAGTFLETSSAEFERVLRVNLGGVVHGCRAFGRQMVARGLGGHIVNLSSAAAYTPQKEVAAYATSKSAVYMLSDCLRAELAPAGIGVSTICPGFVATNIISTTTFSGMTDEEQRAEQDRIDALYRRRNYTPDRVAEQIVRAVRRGRAIVPVTPEARAGLLTSRLAPPLMRRLGRASVL